MLRWNMKVLMFGLSEINVGMDRGLRMRERDDMAGNG